ncbi:MAG: hypothetical protein HYT80_11285 [Euryarchaeota archaeon]|nr:hypothetical protein [Euryarchaeota archaeon]
MLLDPPRPTRTAVRRVACRQLQVTLVGVLVLLVGLLAGCAQRSIRDEVDENEDRKARGCPYSELGQYAELQIKTAITGTLNPGTLELRPGQNGTTKFEISVCKVGGPAEVELDQSIKWRLFGKPQPPLNQTPEFLQPARVVFGDGLSNRSFHLHVIVPNDSPPGSWSARILPRNWTGTVSLQAVESVFVDRDKIN